MAALRRSRRSLFLLQEVRKTGTDFGLPTQDAPLNGWWAETEFPLTPALIQAKGEAAMADSERFKWMIFHLHLQTGLYAGGVFRLEIDLRETPNYPNEPPKAKFLTKIWHPNIKTDGTICHSHLRAPGGANPGTWSPLLRISTLVQGLVAMFDINDPACNPFSPLNPTAAEQFCNDRSAFEDIAIEWTGMYAQPVEFAREAC